MSWNRPQNLIQAAEAIRAADSVLLVCHVRPDGDALGSLLGLTLGLECLGKRVTPVSPDGVPELYRFLPGWERVVTTAGGEWDLAVGLDADGSDRLGAAEELVLRQSVVLDLDHHSGAERYGTIQLVDPTAAATAELVYLLLTELGVELDPRTAECLMAGLLTDTGSFRFSNTSERAFAVAARLRAAGATPGRTYEAVYGRRSFGATRLLGRLLDRAGQCQNGRIVHSWLSAADFQECGAVGADTEGFVDQLRMVAGAQVVLFFREETPGEVRVSLRS
ncbi:MAG: bifunctional oligoribonuclease/PAP phosphatase NrnA, partial [Armatimonadetes bacterium]|nr:bifunctional oligoribonuclease/PAP phosphatase NrnA [Armatimonadota bacterium]